MSEWVLSKRQQISVGKDVEKREPLCTVGGNVNWCNRYGNSTEPPPKIKNRNTIQSSNFISGYFLKKIKTLIQKGSCTPMFIAALFTIAKIRKQPKCPLKDEWTKKVWHIDRLIDRYTHTYIHTHNGILFGH